MSHSRLIMHRFNSLENASDRPLPVCSSSAMFTSNRVLKYHFSFCPRRRLPVILAFELSMETAVSKFLRNRLFTGTTRAFSFSAAPGASRPRDRRRYENIGPSSIMVLPRKASAGFRSAGAAKLRVTLRIPITVTAHRITGTLDVFQ